MGHCCNGSDEAKVYAILCNIVTELIEIYQKENIQLPTPTVREYSGKFILRTGTELNKALAIKSLKEGISLNKYVVKKIKNKLVS